MASRKTSVRFDQANPAMSVFKSRYWSRRMVYILRADKPQQYEHKASRIVYIGETRKGTRRPASSAASKSLEAFGTLRGVRRIDVHPITFRGKKHVRMWEVLERDLLSTFKCLYGGIPCYNRQGHGKKFAVDGIRYFSPKRLTGLIEKLS